MKILNLYAGIGGNRKLWGGNIEVTAIENDKVIAKIYQDFFPNDKVVVTDAHQYLLEHYKEFDFIWSSPPCPSHSKIRRDTSVARGQSKPIFPDMKLYEEIFFLEGNFKGKYVVENVKPYYTPLGKPQECGRHLFWANFIITKKSFPHENHEKCIIKDIAKSKGLTTDFEAPGLRKVQLLRNAVNPGLALHIFKMAFKEKQETL